MQLASPIHLVARRPLPEIGARAGSPVIVWIGQDGRRWLGRPLEDESEHADLVDALNGGILRIVVR